MKHLFQATSYGMSAAMLLLLPFGARVNAQPNSFGGYSEVNNSNISSADPADIITDVLRNIVGYVALIATVVIVIAGIMLVVSNGNETAKDRAKNIVIYTIVGVALIALAAVIVRFFTTLL